MEGIQCSMLGSDPSELEQAAVPEANFSSVGFCRSSSFFCYNRRGFWFFGKSFEIPKGHSFEL
jgi:hypothetical protein